MNVLLKCPASGCDQTMMVKTGSDYSSELITDEKKTCVRCGKDIQIAVRIVAKLADKQPAGK